MNQIRSGNALERLHKHGQRVTADVADIYTGFCSKHGCSIMVKYRFTPVTGTGLAAPVTGDDYIGNSQDYDKSRLLEAKTDGTVPVVYEIGRPANSALNFGDWVFVRDPMSISYSIIEDTGEVLLSIIAMLVGSGWYFRRQARSGGSPGDPGLQLN